MPGTIAGGKRAAITNKNIYGEDFYSRIGAIGGSKLVPKGFAINRKLASKAGKKGGRISKRSKKIGKE